MPGVYRSDKKANIIAIPASGKWHVPLDISLLKHLPFEEQFFNYCKVTDSAGEAINVTLGNDSKDIGAGDGYEWDDEIPVNFSAVVITNLVAAEIAIGEVTVEYARINYGKGA